MGDFKDEKCFTFVWILENASYCLEKKREAIESPAFVVDEIQKTKWTVKLYPRGGGDGNYIACFLHRESDCTGEETVKIKYELALIDEAGLSLSSYNLGQNSFRKGGGWGTDKVEKRSKVFSSHRSTFLPKDALRIRCRIWKETGDLEHAVQCFARTRIGIEKRSFLWRLENFSVLEPEKEHTYLIKSLTTNKQLMSVDLYLTGGLNCEELIRFKFTCCDVRIKYCVLRLYLVDVNGEKVECNQDEFFSKKSKVSHRFNLSFSRQKLIEKKSLYLPDDVLSLHWECVFSKGIVLQEIENVQFGYTAAKQKTPPATKWIKIGDTSVSNHVSHDLIIF